jgi:hypothetical protein
LFFKTFNLNLSPVFPYSLAFTKLEREGFNAGPLDAFKTFTVGGE